MFGRLRKVHARGPGLEKVYMFLFSGFKAFTTLLAKKEGRYAILQCRMAMRATILHFN
jgi:hypothetical protein